MQSLGSAPYAGGAGTQAVVTHDWHDCGADACSIIEVDYYYVEALRRSIGASEVDMAAFDEALTEARASVTPEMERDYEQIAAKLKQEAAAIQPIGFIAPGMLTPRGDKQP